MPEELIGLAAVLMIFGIPMVAIVTGHFQKMAKLRGEQGQKVDTNVMGAIQELKEQFDELRDTTTKYDMSFDAALQRIENRVTHLEGRVSRVEQESEAASQVARTGGA